VEGINQRIFTMQLMMAMSGDGLGEVWYPARLHEKGFC
jgi:hypothetical protein